MFQNTYQLHSAMKEILSIFLNGEDISVIYQKYDGLELDLVEAINSCLSRGGVLNRRFL